MAEFTLNPAAEADAFDEMFSSGDQTEAKLTQAEADASDSGDEDGDEDGGEEAAPVAVSTQEAAQPKADAPPRDAEIQALREQIASLEARTHESSRREQTPEAEADAPALTPDEVLDLIATKGIDGLKVAAARAGYVSKADVMRLMRQNNQELVQALHRDTRILNEIPELAKKDPAFIAEARQVLDAVADMDPQEQAMYLAAKLTQTKRESKARAAAPNADDKRVAAPLRTAARPTKSGMSAGLPPQLLSALKSAGVKVQ